MELVPREVIDALRPALVRISADCRKSQSQKLVAATILRLIDENIMWRETAGSESEDNAR